MKTLYKVLVFHFLFLVSTLMFAQHPVYIHLTEKEGVPDKEFYNIIEGDDGIIWLAADKGLFKYDGATFKTFTHPKQIGLSVFQLQKDNNNVIWFTNTANQIFYIKDDKITLFKDLKKDFKGELTTMLIHNNLIILFTSDKVVILDRIKAEIQYIKTAVYYKNDFIGYNIEPYIFNNEMYFGDKFNNFNKINLSTFQSDYIENGHSYHKNKYLYDRTSLMKIKDRLVYYSNYKKNNGSKVFYSVPLDLSEPTIKLKTEFPDIRIISVCNYEDKLWYCTDNGVYVCELLDDELKIVHHFFKGEFITDVTKDFNNNYWFTSLNKGLFVIPNIEVKQVEFLDKGEGIEKCFKGNTTELLLTTSKKNLYRYHIDKGIQNKLSFLKTERLHYMSYNPFKKEYYLQLRTGLQIFDNQFKFKVKQHGLTSMKNISFLNENEIILASSHTIRHSELRSNNNTFLKEISKENIRSYTCFYNHQNRQAYFGTSEGFLYYKKNWIKKEVLYEGKSIYVKGVTQTKNGDLWCSSFKNGVYVIRSNKVIHHYTTKNGLLSNKNSYIKYKENEVWLAGEKGVQQFNIQNNTFNNLTKQDGIPSYSYNGFELINDAVFVSTPEQLYSFNSKNVFQKKTLLNPYFTSITISDKKEIIKRKYYLNYDQNKLKIEFNTNGFLSKNNIQYQYRLLGSTANWENVPLGSNQITFNSLSQGKYIFQLKASNGKEFSKTKEIQLIINGVFYKQWWFYTLILIIVVSLVWLYFNKRNKRLKESQVVLLNKQHRELENVFLKLESLRSQMNPHFIFNALNSIQDYIIHNEQKLARKYLVKFSRLIRVYLEHSQKDTVSIQEEINALQLYLELEKDRFEDSFNYFITKDLKMEDIQIPTFLIQPYVENAIKHGLLHKKNNRKLSVEFRFNNKQNALVCVITDNGIGRVATTKINAKRIRPKSFSSEANQKRITLLNKTRVSPISLVINDNYDENNMATGTSVVLTIPL